MRRVLPLKLYGDEKMLKVFLVEDEYIVREGIKNNIDWKGHGYDFCGEASDGELAFPMIQKLKPDIVISDIKMPFMDGIELSRLVKKEMPLTEVILLTGFEEFEYAKEAIKIGVAQYLTKPISGEDLIKEVDAIGAKIMDQKKEAMIVSQYERENAENKLNVNQQFFNALVTNSGAVNELIDKSHEIGMDITAVSYSIILLDVQSKNHRAGEYSKTSVKVLEEIKDTEDKSILIFDRNIEGLAFIVKADSAEELDQKQSEFINKTTAYLDEFDNLRYFFGVGSTVFRLSELPVSYTLASRAYAHRFLVNDSAVYYGDKLETTYSSADEFDMSVIDVKQLSKDHLLNFLRTGAIAETEVFVEEFFNEIGHGALESLVLRQYVVMDSYFGVVSFVEDMGYTKEETSSLTYSQDAVKTLNDSKEYIARLIHDAIDLRDKKATNRYSELVNEAIDYIEENYGNEDLSLNMLALHVNVSPSHLSMIFSQQTGVTFIKYLTDYRMKKAKELLKCSSKRSNEIAAEVGYQDSHYFSYIFKKTQGMTPTQYRGN